MRGDAGVPAYLGRVLDAAGAPVGTCFQVEPGLLATAWHVLVDAGGGDVGAVVSVDGLAPGGPGPGPAVVLRVDPVHDLAVLRRESPLPESVGELVATDGVGLRVEVVVTGHAVVPDPARDQSVRYLHAVGTWAGGTMRDDSVPLGRLSAKDLVRGMSGAPVRRLAGDAVVGVVSERYNSADGWLRDTVWVARVEDLAVLLAGLSTVELAGPPPLAEAAALVLAVDETTVRLRGAGVDVAAAHAGVWPGLVNAIDDVRRARARAGTARAELVLAEPGGAPVSMRRAGELLAESFLPGPVADALAGVLRRAGAASMPVLLGVDAPGFSSLPWEALPDPVSGVPLALHRLVTVYRMAPAVAPRVVGGPLRIVVAISAPSRGGGGVLDYERELRAVLAAVKGARAGDAQVRIVPFATTAAIRQALAAADVHVLHISAHGGPGTLDLEDEDGAVREVTAAEFVAEAVPPGGMPPVVCLAACYTSAPAAAAAASFAAGLVARGAAAVVGTETSVTDRYATRVYSRTYAELAQAPAPDVLAAVAQARRVVQDQLAAAGDPRDQAVSGLDEWATVTVLAAGPTLVFDPATCSPAVRPEPATRSIAGLTARDPGEFVGRRVEQRDLPAVLVGGSRPGVALTGIGGVGKTTLAAEVIRRTLEREPARVIAPVTGETNADAVLAAAAAALRRSLLVSGATAGPALSALAVAAQVDLPWRERLDVLREHLLDAVPLLLVLDNFEDNLTGDNLTGPAAGARQVRDPALAGLLAAWAAAPGRSRILLTCRYPFDLPDGSSQLLDWRHLGPLTLAETRKLIWSLPRLDRLDDDDVEQVWRMVGGHPRTLEYVDALLVGGEGRFPDITRRLAAKVEDTLGERADAWLHHDRTLDAALADAVTVAADDVLLDQLRAEIATVPGAEATLLGASVYREPVDLDALLFHLGQVDDEAGWVPDRRAIEDRILAHLQAHGLEPDTLDAALQAGDLSRLPAELVEAITPDLAELSAVPAPPRSTTADLSAIAQALARSTLLSLDADNRTVFVHRWTASELTRRWTRDGKAAAVRAAHRHAAQYWQWRVQVWPQARQADLHDLLETRHHLLAGGDLDAAAEVGEAICRQLEEWGAWDQATSLVQDTLLRLSADHPRRPAWIHQLGVLAQRRGDYGEAERRYRQSLDITERLGDQAGMAAGYHQLGVLAQDRGDYGEAERRYGQALDIAERLGDQASLASGYGQLGMLAQDRGDYGEAERRYGQALDIAERLGDQAGMATSYHQLGMLAQDRGDYGEAERRYRQSLEIKERLGKQAGMATSYHNLGVLAQARGDYGEAERRYRQSLDIDERLGNQAGMATSYHNLGALAQARGDYGEAERRYRQSLDIAERLGNQAGMATSYHNLGSLRAAQDDLTEAVHWHLRALALRLKLNVPQAANSAKALGQLRTRIGEQQFRQIIERDLDEESARNLMSILND